MKTQPTPIQPTLVVGLGGTGTLAISQIKELAYRDYLTKGKPMPLLRFLAIDTEFMTAPDAEPESSGLDADDSFERGYENVLGPEERHSISYARQDMQQWLADPGSLMAGDFADRERLASLEKAAQGDGAGGYGVLGKLALWSHLESVVQHLENIICELNNDESVRNNLQRYYPNEYERDREAGFNVFVVGSIGGGTGKGSFLTVGAIIAELLRKHGLFDASMRTFVNYMPSCFRLNGRNVGRGYHSTIQVNQYASYKELESVLADGYKFEERLASLLKIGRGRDRIKQVFQNVINVGAQQQNKLFVGDYGTINRMVAETVNGIAFGGMYKDLRAYLISNKEAFVAGNPIVEVAAPGTTRRRDYGRIGRFKLVYPVDQLLRYAAAYHTAEVLQDMYQGHLTPVPEGKRESPARLAEAAASRFASETQRIGVTRPLFSLEQVRTFCSTFDGDWLAQIQTRIASAVAGIGADYVPDSNTNRTAADQQAGAIVTSFLREDSEAGAERSYVTRLRASVKDYGLEHGIQATRQLITKLEVELQEAYATSVAAVLQDSRHASFRLERDGRELLRHIETRRAAALERARALASEDGGVFAEARAALQRDATAWKAADKKRWPWTEPAAKDISAATTDALQRVVDEAHFALKAAEKAANDYLAVSIYVQLAGELDELVTVMEANASLIHVGDSSLGESGLLRDLLIARQNILREPQDSLEQRVYGTDEAEFIAFADQLRYETETIGDYAQRQLNSAFMDRIITERMDARTLYRAVGQYAAVVHRLKSQFSICNFLLSGDTPATRSALQDMLSRASLLGVLAGSKVKGAAPAGQQLAILQLEDPAALAPYQSIFDTEEGMRKVRSNNREEIILTRYESALPLFVYHELYACQTRALDEWSGDQAVDPIGRYTHVDFVDAPEPIGNPFPVDRDDIAMVVNFLVHAGTIRCDEEDVVQVVKPRATGFVAGDYEVLYDSQLAGPAHEREVRFEDFVDALSERRDWLELLAERTRRRFADFFTRKRDEKKAAVAYFARYTQTCADPADQFPCIPPVVYRMLRPASTKKAHVRELAQFLDAEATHVQHKYAYQREEPPVGQPLRDVEEVQGVFAEPVPAMFERSRPDSSPTGAPLPPAPGATSHYVHFPVAGRTSDRALSLPAIVAAIREDDRLLVHVDEAWRPWRGVPAVAAAYQAAASQNGHAPAPPPPPSALVN